MTTSDCLKPASTSPWAKRTTFVMLEGFEGFGSTPAVKMVSCRSGASGGHGGFDVQDVGEDFVFDLDQVERLFGDELRCRGDGGDRVAIVEDFALGHAVQRQVAEVMRRGADMGALGRDVGEVGAGDDGFDAGEGSGFVGVD